MPLIWHMIMSSTFLVVWYLAVLGTVWTENKKMVVPGSLKCTRNNREIQPAGRSTGKRSQPGTDGGEWGIALWLLESTFLPSHESKQKGVLWHWLGLWSRWVSKNVKRHLQCQVRGKLLIPRCWICSFSRQYFCCDMFPGTTFNGFMSCTVGRDISKARPVERVATTHPHIALFNKAEEELADWADGSEWAKIHFLG